MKQECHWILLQDELPRIGSGFREVEVSFGRKWVHIRTRNVKYKVRPAAWASLRDKMRKYWDRNQEEQSSSRFNTFTAIGE